MPFQPRIAIVGGGPSGLALGLSLQQRGIRSTIYELRSKPTPEELSQVSGMLDLHEESGLRMMRECGLWDGFQAALGDCSEETRVLNRDGRVLYSDDDRGESRPEIPRNELTKLLLDKIPSDMIRWDHKIVAAQESENAATGATEITLDFGPNGTVTCDFVVGADGAWSRTRTLLTEVKPFYSGVQFITVTMRHASQKYPNLVELNGSGTVMALGGGNGILTHRGPQDSIRAYVAISRPEENWAKVAGLEDKTAAEVKTTLLSSEELFGKWAPPLQDLIAAACDEQTRDNPGSRVDCAPLYMLPVGARWEHRAGVTLVGDAAHLMTPFAGEGVNLALWDSLDLTHALCGVPEVEDAAAWQAALDPRVRKYEESILARAAETGEETVRNKEVMFSDNGAQLLADIFKSYQNGPPGEH